jgi:hypothetical protein
LIVSAWTHDAANPPTSISAPSIGALLDRGDFAGNIATGGLLGAAIIGENLSGDILAGASFGPDNQPGGGNDTFAAGRIGTVLVGGNISGSLIAAGLTLSTDTFPPSSGSESPLPDSSIRALRIGGVLSDDSRVLSIVLPPRVWIGTKIVATPGDPRFVS